MLCNAHFLAVNLKAMKQGQDPIPVKSKIEPEQMLKVSQMKPVIKPTRPHKHDNYFELIFLSDGAGSHQIDTDTHEVVAPMVFSLKPGQVHCWDFSIIPKGYVILFREELLKGYPETKHQLFSLPPAMPLSVSNTLFPWLEQFYCDFKANQSEAFMAAMLNALLIRTIEAGKLVEARPLPPSEIDLFYQFKALLDKHYLHLRQTSDYAGLLKISNYRLNAVCRQAANRQAAEIIRMRVVTEAKNKIAHTPLSISEVAYQLHFSDPSNFVKFFKSATNLTPTEYRQKAH